MKTYLQSATLFLVAAVLLSLSSGCGGTISSANAPNNLSKSASGSSSSSGAESSASGSNSSESSGSGNSGSASSTSGSSQASSGSSSSITGSSGSIGSSSGTTTSAGVGSSSGSGASQAVVPTDAIAAAGLQALDTWQGVYDSAASGGSGISTGVMSLVAEPSKSGQAREFTTTYSNSGGERYFVSFGSDTTSTNFFYDVWVYLADAPTGIANLEFDMDQVMANGQTVIFGFQCDGYSGTWDYTENADTPQSPVDHWVHSAASCNVQDWTAETWHHIQVSYSRDNSGNVSYNAVWLDDAEQPINATVPSAFALGWGPALLTNFQVDGLGASGSSTVYLDELTVSRW